MKHSKPILTFFDVPASLFNDIENGEVYGVFDSCTWFSLLYWDPVKSDCLDCVRGKENPYDYFAIKTCQKDGKTVGHLPVEISQPNKYLPD